MTRRSIHSLCFLAVISILALAHCATPISPTGGPVDSIPPTLLGTEPLNESTGFEGDKITIEFSEYLNVASFANALEITPELEEGYELNWKGRKLDIEFKGDLRESTTYIINIDKSLKDLHGVALTRPISFAFSTGDLIDSGRLAGEIVDPRSGDPITNMDVLAFAEDRASEKALYRTQVDDKGFFSFAYLPKRAFRIVGIIDQNRNRMVDDNEVIAISESSSYVASTDSTIIPKAKLLKGRIDRTIPRLLRVRAEGSNVFRLEFSETVRLDSNGVQNWVLRDSLVAANDSGAEGVGLSGFRSFADPNQILIRANDSLRTSHLLNIIALQDSAGNKLDTLSVLIKPSQKKLANADFLAFQSLGPNRKRDSVFVLFPKSRPSFTHSLFLDESNVISQIDSVALVSDNWKRSPEGNLFLGENTDIDGSEMHQISVSGTPFVKDTNYVAYYQELAEQEMGSITGFVDDDADWILEFYNQQWGKEALRSISSSDSFNSGSLPKGSYSLRVIQDLDQDGQWTAGSFDPFKSPEPLKWVRDSLQVQSRFETVMDTLRW